MSYVEKLSEVLRSLGLMHNEIKKIGSQIETATSEYKANQEKEKTPLVVTRPKAEIDQEESRKTRHEARDTNRLRIEVLGVGVAAIVAFATLGQLILTRRAVDIAAISAQAAQSSAKASQDAVEATKKSIDVTVENFRIDQRAWLFVSKVEAIPLYSVTNPGNATIFLSNTGKTPALRVSMVRYSVGNRNAKLATPEKKFSMNVAPNSIDKDTIFIPLPARASGEIFYVRFVIEYWDVFQNAGDPPHTVQFCGFYPTAVPPVFMNCSEQKQGKKK